MFIKLEYENDGENVDLPNRLALLGDEWQVTGELPFELDDMASGE